MDTFGKVIAYILFSVACAQVLFAPFRVGRTRSKCSATAAVVGVIKAILVGFVCFLYLKG